MLELDWLLDCPADEEPGWLLWLPLVSLVWAATHVTDSTKNAANKSTFVIPTS
jgi:hypothetical protein